MNGIPVLTAEGDCIARAWENSLVRLYESGCDIRTQYDKPADPPSKDATMIVTVDDPLAEPMIHRDLPGGFEELQEYVMEVCEGIKDHCVRDPNDPGDTRWEYTYHQRLFNYQVPTLAPTDQIEGLCERLANTLHPSGPGDHLEGLGRQHLLRSGLFAEHLVPDYRGVGRAGTEHERPLPFQRRLQGGLDEHFCTGAATTDNRRANLGAIARAGPSRPLLPHGRQLPHLRLEPAGVRGSLPGLAPEAELRRANRALRGHSPDHGGGPARHPGKGPKDGTLRPG